MTQAKKRTIAILLTIIAATFLFYVIIDFSRFYGIYSFYNAFPVHYIKRVNVVLSAAIVWLAGGDCFYPGDSGLMKTFFIFVFFGEAAFLLRIPPAAIGIFAICQGLLIFRHVRGLKWKLRHTGLKQKTILVLCAAAALLLLMSALRTYGPVLGPGPLLFISCFYGLVVSVSLWAGLANYILKLSPKTNSGMIAMGMLCFYCCDFMVGLDGILEYGFLWLWADSLIWVFYTPAVVLLALSCYRYEQEIFS